MQYNIIITLTLLVLCQPYAWMQEQPEATTKKQSFRFMYQPPQVGAVATKSNQRQMAGITTITKDGKTVKNFFQKMAEVETRDEMVLEMTGNLIQKLKVHYLVSQKMQQYPGSEAVKNDSPVAGKTYIIQRQGERLVVTDAAGKAPSALEVDYLQKKYYKLGIIDPMTEFLNQKSFIQGDKIDLPAAVAQKLLQDNQGKVQAFSLTFQKVQEINGKQCGVFATILNMATKNAGGMESIIELTGTTVLTADCWPVAMELKGKMLMHSQIPQGEILVKGVMAVSNRAEYRGSK